MDRNRVVVSDYTKGISTNTNVQVFVRARPPAHQDDSKDLEALFGISARDPKRIEVKNRNTTGGVGEHAFNFDRVFWTQTRQEEIFASVCQQQVEHCVRGYNSCAFAYGQTGSGKVNRTQAAIAPSNCNGIYLTSTTPLPFPSTLPYHL